MAKLHGLRIQGDDLITAEIRILSLFLFLFLCPEHHAKEEAARRENRGVEVTALELVLRGSCAIVSGAAQRRAGTKENRVSAGSGQVVPADHVFTGNPALQDTHAAVEDVHLGAFTHHQLAVGGACHVQKTCAELLWQVARHLLQPTARLVGRLPPGQPLRAHRCRRPVLRLQRSQDVRHQVRREQHALDRPERQRVVGGHALLGSRLQRRVLGAQLELTTTRPGPPARCAGAGPTADSADWKACSCGRAVRIKCRGVPLRMMWARRATRAYRVALAACGARGVWGVKACTRQRPSWTEFMDGLQLHTRHLLEIRVIPRARALTPQPRHRRRSHRLVASLEVAALVEDEAAKARVHVRRRAVEALRAVVLTHAGKHPVLLVVVPRLELSLCSRLDRGLDRTLERGIIY
eukprot:scaffold6758_cov56-Phaeocystis_antarctica.AAC.5